MEEKILNSILLKANGISVDNNQDTHALIAKDFCDLISNDILKIVYSVINNWPKNHAIKKEALISHLLKTYILYNYDDKATFIKYLKSSNIQDVIYLFEQNEYIGYELIKCYFGSYVQEKTSISNEAKFLALKYTSDIEVVLLTDLLREKFELLYNTLLINSSNKISVTDVMQKVISREGYVGGRKDIEEAVEFLQKYNTLLIRVMYADIYEDLVAHNVLEHNEKAAVKLINAAIGINKYQMPKNPEDMEVLINYFAYLCTLKEKRVDNRKMLKSENKRVLRQINPLWMLDESGIISKR